MDKGQALQSFWSSFGIPAIDEQSAYDSGTLDQLHITMPYITYEVASGNLEANMPLTGNLWYKSTSWAEITKKADQIAAFIGYGGKTYRLDNGYMHVMLPQGQIYRRGAEETDNIRRIIFNIEVLFATAT